MGMVQEKGKNDDAEKNFSNSAPELTEGDGIRNPHGGLALGRNKKVNPYSGREGERIQGERTGGGIVRSCFSNKKKKKSRHMVESV